MENLQPSGERLKPDMSSISPTESVQGYCIVALGKAESPIAHRRSWHGDYILTDDDKLSVSVVAERL